MTSEPLLRIVLVGGGGVGKSTLTIIFLRGMFVEDYDPTIEESYRKDITVDEESLTIEIVDTAGQEEYGAIRDRYLRTGDGFLIVFSITSKPTYGEAEHFAKRIRRAKDTDQIAIVFAANKADLESLRAVSRDQAQELANRYHAPFYETSARMGMNVDDAFHDAVREVKRVRNLQESSEGGGKKKRKKKKKRVRKRKGNGPLGQCIQL